MNKTGYSTDDNVLSSNAALIQDKLQADPLYLSLNILPEMRSQLFDPKIVGRNPKDAFSTTECSEDIFFKPNSTLRYYVRTFEDYLEVSIEGKMKRISFIGLFKLHMIFLLIDNGQRISDIQSKLGIKTPIISKTNSKTSKYSDELLDHLFGIVGERQNNVVHFINLQERKHSLEKEIMKLSFDAENEESKIESIETKIENLRIQKKVDVQSINLLRKTMEARRKKSSFLALFATPKEPDIQESEILVDSSTISDNSVIKSFKEIIKTKRDRITEMNETKKVKEEELQSLTQQMNRVSKTLQLTTNEIETLYLEELD